MSVAGLEEFVKMAAESEELLARLAAQSDVEGIIRLAAEHGCELTATEAEQLVAFMQANDGALREADLANIAGGIDTVPLPDAKFGWKSRR